VQDCSDRQSKIIIIYIRYFELVGTWNSNNAICVFCENLSNNEIVCQRVYNKTNVEHTSTTVSQFKSIMYYILPVKCMNNNFNE